MSEITTIEQAPSLEGFGAVPTIQVSRVQEIGTLTKIKELTVPLAAPIAGALALGNVAPTIAEAAIGPYMTKTEMGAKAWRTERKILIAKDIFRTIPKEERNLCQRQLKNVPRSYSDCAYPLMFNRLINRSKKSNELASWVKRAKLAEPGRQHRHDRTLLYYKLNPNQYKTMLLESEAGINYKSPIASVWRKVNSRECGAAYHSKGFGTGPAYWNCRTGNGYYGGLQMDGGFMTFYNPSAVKRWGDASNWPINVQMKAADRAYGGWKNEGARGLIPWPSSNKAQGSYPVNPAIVYHATHPTPKS